MFKRINHISDIQPFVEDKKEIRFVPQLKNNITIGCYVFMDSHTFDSPEAIECRGIAFDSMGRVVSRPLHKFFNVGEKEWLHPDLILKRDDIAAVYEKLDGSMIATALEDGCRIVFRSKKSFESDVVVLANQLLEEDLELKSFVHEITFIGCTAIFELTHPEARIVVQHKEPKLTLLHVRHNTTGAYVTNHKFVQRLVALHKIPTVKKYEGKSIQEIFDSLETMEGQEGYVIQFKNGDMAKVKCPWYKRLHRSITFLRERDIALLSLHEELDDVKASLTEAGIPLDEVNKVEERLKNIMVELVSGVEERYTLDKHLDRKEFAIKHKEYPFFGLLMALYTGKDPNYNEWFEKNALKETFSLRPLTNQATAEAIEG